MPVATEREAMRALTLREEGYLHRLRRFMLGLATFLLVLSALALVAAAYQALVSSYHAVLGYDVPLRSRAALLETINPCPYLTDSAPDSNGRDGEGYIPVKQTLTKCAIEEMPVSDFKTPAEAYGAYGSTTVEWITSWPLSREYENPDWARKQLAESGEQAVKSAMEPIDGADLPPARKQQVTLLVANLLASYASATKAVVTVPGAYERKQERDYYGNARVNHQEEWRKVEHMTNLRFFSNQLRVGFNAAVTSFNQHNTDKALALAKAGAYLYRAFQLFAAFLGLMFLFVFVKIELDLRDIRDALTSSQPMP